MTADDEEFGDELRRLFGDKRLDVPLREGAGEAVVAGVRRIRRRRTALATAGGALTAALLVAGNLALADLRSEPGQVALPAATVPVLSVHPSQSPTPSTPSAPNAVVVPGPEPTSQTAKPPATAQIGTTSTRPPRSTGSPSVGRAPLIASSVLGPAGYGRLELGMSFEDAKATGMLAGADTPPASCTTYRLSEGLAVSSVYLSPTAGIVRFTAGAAHTPEGIGVGSTLAQLQVAYRDVAKGSSTYTASTGSGGSYVFYLDNDVVTTLELVGAVAC